jgi:transposase-like protein
MPPPEPELPETRERPCPACQSEEIAPVGHVVAGDRLVKVRHRCESCGIGFWFVRKPLV